MKHTFETIMILNGALSTENYNYIVHKYAKILRDDLKSHIRSINKIGKKKLAYEIKGNKDGWYVIFTHTCEQTIISDLERYLRIDEDVIKFMTIKVEGEDHPEEEISSPANIKCEQTQAEKITAWEMIYER